jgi:peptidyl-prolyl cis-trans isomerase SurA
MKKYILSALAAMAGCFLLSVMSIANGSVVVDRVIAVVNDDIITMSDLQREAAKNHGGKRDDGLLLEDMINRKLELAAAKRAGMDTTDKELDEAIAEIMKKNSLDRAQFEAALAKDGLTLEQYRTELKEQMTVSRVFNKFVRSGLAVEETEIRAFYDRNFKNYSLPEEIRVRQIMFKIPGKASTAQINAVREKAHAVYERAKRGEDFVRLVREFSESETAGQDGDLGFMQRGHTLPEIEQAARTMKPGEIAGPLQCASGFHLIRLEEVRTPVKPYEVVRDEIANAIYQQKLENTYRAWLQTLRSESHVENRL